MLVAHAAATGVGAKRHDKRPTVHGPVRHSGSLHNPRTPVLSSTDALPSDSFRLFTVTRIAQILRAIGR